MVLRLPEFVVLPGIGADDRRISLWPEDQNVVLTHVTIEPMVVDQVHEIWPTPYADSRPVFFTTEADEVNTGHGLDLEPSMMLR